MPVRARASVQAGAASVRVHAHVARGCGPHVLLKPPLQYNSRLSVSMKHGARLRRKEVAFAAGCGTVGTSRYRESVRVLLFLPVHNDSRVHHAAGWHRKRVPAAWASAAWAGARRARRGTRAVWQKATASGGAGPADRPGSSIYDKLVKHHLYIGIQRGSWPEPGG